MVHRGGHSHVIINYIQNSRSIISYKNGSMDKVMMCAISVAVGAFGTISISHDGCDGCMRFSTKLMMSGGQICNRYRVHYTYISVVHSFEFVEMAMCPLSLYTLWFLYYEHSTNIHWPYMSTYI